MSSSSGGVKGISSPSAIVVHRWTILQAECAHIKAKCVGICSASNKAQHRDLEVDFHVN